MAERNAQVPIFQQSIPCIEADRPGDIGDLLRRNARALIQGMGLALFQQGGVIPPFQQLIKAGLPVCIDIEADGSGRYGCFPLIIRILF